MGVCQGSASGQLGQSEPGPALATRGNGARAQGAPPQASQKVPSAGLQGRRITSPNRAIIDPPEAFMGSKSAQNLMLMPNLLSDYVGYSLNLCIFCLFRVYFPGGDSRGLPGGRQRGGSTEQLRQLEPVPAAATCENQGARARGTLLLQGPQLSFRNVRGLRGVTGGCGGVRGVSWRDSGI